MINDKKDINLSIEEISLTSLTIEENDKDEEKIFRKNNIELLKHNSDNDLKVLELKYTDVVCTNKKISLELIGVFYVEGDITIEEIEEILNSSEANEIAYPLLSEATHIISFITSKTNVIPLILPPTLKKLD